MLSVLFMGPFDLILIVSTVVYKLVELYIFIFPFINGLKKFLHFFHFNLMKNLLVTCLRSKKICMFAVIQPSMLKSTDHKPFFARIHKKWYKTYICLLKSQRFASSVLFNVTEMVYFLSSWLECQIWLYFASVFHVLFAYSRKIITAKKLNKKP